MMWRTIKFVCLIIFGLFSGLYLLYILYFYTNQQEMVFQALPLPQEYVFKFEGNFKEVNIPVEGQATINALLFRVPHTKGLIFYLHGNAGNLSGWGDVAGFYNELGYDVFIPDYRGYGKSTGSVEDEKQVLSDMSQCFKTISKNYTGDKITIVGYSIGTGIAAFLASKEKVHALILEAPYFNFSELADSKAPYFPDGLKKFTFATNEWLPKAKCPVIIFHGDNDQLIPVSNTFRLQKLLKSSGSFYLLKAQGHIGINENEQFRKEISLLLR